MEQAQEMKKKMTLIGIGAFILALVVVAMVVNIARKRMVAGDGLVPTGSVVQPTLIPKTGLMKLGLLNGKTEYTKGQQITVMIYANSYKASVTGYDVVVHYDPNVLVYSDVKSLQNGMDLLDTDEVLNNGKHELIVTGVQALSKKDPFVFDNAELAELTFTAQAPGTVNLTPVYELGSNRDSNLFDGSTNEILSGVEGVTLVIK